MVILFSIEFQSLLRGETVSHQQEEDEVIISGESSAHPSPPPDSHLVTAQLEGSTLTRAQYNTIHSLINSLLYLPAGDLVYDGHTLNPLTLHWHCSTVGRRFVFLSHYTAMAQEGIRRICVDGREVINIRIKVRKYIILITVFY